MERFFFYILIIIYCQNLYSQNLEENYLIRNSQKIELTKPSFQIFDDKFYSNDLFFFGFIHGSTTPQILDYELLIHLYEKGIKYYAPEIGYSYAYFLNNFLETGDESYLNYVLEDEIRGRVPQDASIEFKEKWKKIYAFNKTKQEGDKITIIGTDASQLNITHLAHLAPKEKTGIALIDSLHLFKELPKYKSTTIWSGKKIQKSGKKWEYFFPASDEYLFQERFLKAYRKNKNQILKAFGETANEVENAICIYEQNKDKRREDAIFLNFKRLILPLINQGEKIYSNYGFSHVLQEKINGYSYIANRLKDSLNNEIKLTTILGLLANSEVLKERKANRGKKIYIRGYKFHGVDYNGYKTSKYWDGDSILERINGISMLKRISKDNEVTLFKLDGDTSPFKKSLFFIDYKRYRESLFRKGFWQTEKDSSTTDYIQYILFIQNSKSNRPYPPN